VEFRWSDERTRAGHDWVSAALCVVAATCLALLMVCCSGCDSLPRHWVEADRANYDALVPEIERWCAPVTCPAGDTFFLYTEPERGDLAGLVQSWRMALEAAEQLLEED